MAVSFKDISSGSYALTSEGNLYIGGESLGGFKSGSISFSANTTTNSSRDDQGWQIKTPGARSVTVQISFLKKKGDVAQQALAEWAAKSQADWSSKCAVIAWGREYKHGTPSQTDYLGFAGRFALTAYEENEDAGDDGGSSAVSCSATFELCDGGIAELKTSSGTFVAPSAVTDVEFDSTTSKYWCLNT